MKHDGAAFGPWGQWLRMMMPAALALLAACGSSAGSDAAAVDVGTGTDTPPGTDAAVTSDVPKAQDAADPGSDANLSDAGLATSDAAVGCAPAPSGGPLPAGTAAQQTAGPVVASTAARPELTEAVADSQYTIRKALAEGGPLTVPADLATPTLYGLADAWDPLSNGIGDPTTFNPTYTVASDGTGTHRTIGAAITDAVFLAGCSRVYIRILPGTYREQVTVPSKTSAPPLTLYSTDADANKTVIVFNASAATTGNMSASATLTVKALTGFQMKNLTISNDYLEGSASGNDQSAVAFLNQADRSQFENVRFLGNIATLYLKSVDANTVARSYFRGCYVEGDDNIILGRGTAVFDHTEIKVLSARQLTGGAVAFPSTMVFNRYGFLFDSCTFSAEAGATGTFLGHQWFESSNAAAVGKMIVRNSTLGGHIAVEPWSAVGARLSTPKTTAGTTPLLVYTSDDYFAAGTGPMPPEAYLAEFRNSGAGAHR